MGNPSFGDYDIFPLITIFFEFIYLLGYGIIGLTIDWSNKSSMTIMVGFSLIGGFLLITPCTISLIRFHSYILSDCMLAFGLVASLIVAILHLLFFLDGPKERNPNAPKKSKQKSIGTKVAMKEYQSRSKENRSMCDYLLIDTNNVNLDHKQPLETNNAESQKESISNSFKHEIERYPRKDSKEEGNVSRMSSISKGEIEESIIKELPAMHNPEIMNHMKDIKGQKVVGEKKVVWDRTHFIIALESGGNS